tara:strand:+ start:6188 stop:6340 length:153 start_codon:yes stop_codon:yes gene_type:complete
MRYPKGKRRVVCPVLSAMAPGFALCIRTVCPDGMQELAGWQLIMNGKLLL